MKTHEDYMHLALTLAKKGLGHTSPNPMVGAVLVKNHIIIGMGFHTAFGKSHAEVEAIKDARNSGHDPRGSTLYVNLEPCAHTGKTPPCTQALIESGIEKVFVAQEDPNPKVSGKGISQLKEAGILVEQGILQEEALWLNRVFNHAIQKKTPYVFLKTAISLDGKTATKAGHSKWITGQVAREEGRKLRGQVMAVLTGRGTLEADNPLMSARTEGTKEPIRIILDRQLRAGCEYQIFSKKSLSTSPVWVVCEADAPKVKQKALEDRGIKCLTMPVPFKLANLMNVLGELGIDSLLIESGGTLSGLAITEGIVHELCAFIGPKLIGSKDAKGMLEVSSVVLLEEAPRLSFKEVRALGEDLFIRAVIDPKQNVFSKEDRPCLQVL